MKKLLGLFCILILMGCSIEQSDNSKDVFRGLTEMYLEGYQDSINCMKQKDITYCETVQLPALQKAFNNHKEN